MFCCLCVSTVSWSSAPSLSPLLGEMVVEDTTLLQCNITGLVSVSSAQIPLQSITDGLLDQFLWCEQSIIRKTGRILSRIQNNRTKSLKWGSVKREWLH